MNHDHKASKNDFQLNKLTFNRKEKTEEQRKPKRTKVTWMFTSQDR